MAGPVSISVNALDSFVCSANKAVELCLVRQEQDIQDKSKVFHPDFTHQLFGDNESIFGYKDLRVKLYYSGARLATYLGMTYTEKVNPLKCDGVQADEVLKVIDEKLQPGYFTNMSDFVSSLSKDATFVPHGDLLHSFTTESVKDSELESGKFEIYEVDVTTPGFQDYHERLQTFLLWFVDAASFISLDDDRWHFYLVFEKYSSDGNNMYAIAGYCTVYHYYAYPNNIRPRISQMLVLPPFQRCGVGAELLRTIVRRYADDPEVTDITVEDPSEDFSRLRDFVDAENCIKLQSFQKQNLLEGFTEDMAKEAQEKFKINKRQARRVYEILRLHITDISNSKEYKNYRLDVKRRLNKPFQKQKSYLVKLQRMLRPEEFSATCKQFASVEKRMEQLDRLYKDLEEEYRHILERMSTAKVN